MPSDVLLIKNFGKDTAGNLSGEPHCGAQQLSYGNCFQVQKIQSRMTHRDLGHARNGRSRIGEQDLASEFEKAQNRLFLLAFLQLLEWPRQMATCSNHRRTTCPVVPTSGGVQDNRPAFGEANQQLLNQQSVVDYDQLSSRGHLGLVISEVWIVDRCDPIRVSFPQHATEFLTSHSYPARYDQGRLAEINEADLATRLDTPAVAQVGRQAGLSPVGHPRVRRSHTCAL
jgi:hypothetical protein